ncbi:hypothetical protein BD626DRAFT_408456 [Schizophyllum amplum]|uniref:ASST-domain-containing protein n=1 Tax=Schizophyllum amplum TaxID=97359 RepID=A0A550C509_9AGAR|nr:hypothetical protein BD626DRAFT_408456 [Auriculariopsis ampla]
MFSVLLRLAVFGLLAALASCAPSVSLLGNTLLDNSGIYFVSYDGLVNVNSFQLSGVLTYGDYQFAAWYTANGAATLARRTLPDGDWQSLTLDHTLQSEDSHDVIALGVSPEDGVLHVAMDCHSSIMYYTSSEAGLATGDASWSSSSFGSVVNTLGNLNITNTITYPQFVVTPQNLLQFVYRTGISGNGEAQLAEYSGGSWKGVGQWSSASGTYTSSHGSSSARSLYIHGFTYHNERAYVTGTWREQSASVSCNGGGLTNHDTVYFYSDDYGRSWKNNASQLVGTSGSSPIAVSTPGIIVDALNPDHALMNQESQAVDSAGRLHAIISYVPGRFTQCVTSYQAARTAYGHAFHLYQTASGAFAKVEIPYFINAVGRSQIAFDAADNVYVVLPYVDIVTASASSGWTDWDVAYNGTEEGLNAFGEVTLDRARLADGVLSVLYQEATSGSSSPVRVIDFELSG